MRGHIMSGKLFVGNLPLNVTESALRTLFVRHGYDVSDIDLVREPLTGQSQGFAYVTLSPSADPSRAIEDINGNDFEGRRLMVNEWPLHRKLA
jgi:RNA recognition motif-containing protein